MSKYFTCPHCGADVPVKALACPECGSDDETGWSEEAKYAHLLPDREAPEERGGATRGLQSYGLGAVAAVLVVSILLSQGLTWSIYVVPLLVLAAGIAYYLRNVTGQSGAPWGEEARLYRQLMERCRGDRERADRMIAYERERTPHFNRVQLLQKALYRFERDGR